MRALLLALLVACGSSPPAPTAAVPGTAPSVADQDPFDVTNSTLRDELSPLIAAGSTTADYSALKGSFAHRIRAPYADIVEATPKQLDDIWTVELRVISERDKERTDLVYVKQLADEAAAQRAAELLLQLRDHHKSR